MGLFKGAEQLAGTGRAGAASDVTLAADNTFTGDNTFTDGFNVGTVDVSHSPRLTRFIGDTTLANFVVSGNTITAITVATTLTGGTPTIAVSGAPGVLFTNTGIDSSGTSGNVTALSVGTTDVFAATGFVSAFLNTGGGISTTFDTQANAQAFVNAGVTGTISVTYDLITQPIPPSAVVGDVIELHTGTATSLGSTLGVHYTITSHTIGTSITVDRAIVVGSNTGAAYFAPPTDTLELDSALIVPDGVYLGGDSVGNFLEDYEEGTWTPLFIGFSATVTSATYTKIGNLVTVYLDTESLTPGTGGVRITGLPFSVVSSRPAQIEVLGAAGTFFGVPVTSIVSVVNRSTGGVAMGGDFAAGTTGLLMTAIYETDD
ncbi:MAG: hypothetical protein K0U41_06975 [Gammaproteobacteria bacterium]|nr:hypothetical protein [Gammaproteobacteria bacterium]